MGHIKKGELTQEEKELLEVIGKGTGAGLVPRRCTLLAGRGGARGTLGYLQSGKNPFCLCLGTDCRGGELRDRSVAAIRSRLPSLDL